MRCGAEQAIEVAEMTKPSRGFEIFRVGRFSSVAISSAEFVAFADSDFPGMPGCEGGAFPCLPPPDRGFLSPCGEMTYDKIARITRPLA
jgi:hypothetical protein